MSNQQRVTIFLNGTERNGKVLALCDDLKELIARAIAKFSLATDTQAKLFMPNGGEIDDAGLIRDDEILYLCPDGETFQKNSTKKSCTEDKIKSVVEKMEKMALSNDWLKLNIGGRIFTTTRDTIVSKEPNSMLARMFDVLDSDQPNRLMPSKQDENGAFLIDRSPEYFEPLLGYLRHGTLILDKHLNPNGVLEEAKFYGLYSLIPELESCIVEAALLQNTIERSIGAVPLTRREVIRAVIQTSTDQNLRFQGVNMSGADLSKLDLSNINFKYAILRGANLQGANLRRCCLERADISMCNLEGVILVNCHMVCSNLEGSILRGSNMDGQAMNEMTNLEGANLNNVNLEGSQMGRVNLRVASLKNANMQNCNLDGACLAGANLENCDLSGSDLKDANLRGANLKGTRFELIHTPLHMSFVAS